MAAKPRATIGIGEVGLMEMDKQAIQQLLPHRGPMLLLDEVLAVEAGTAIHARKYVRADEWWCEGHFPGNPVMPGVLITEALAQAAAVVYMSGYTGDDRMEMYLVGMDKLRFRRMVRPGDTLDLHVSLLQHRRQMYWFEVSAIVGDEVAANGKMMATIMKHNDGT